MGITHRNIDHRFAELHPIGALTRHAVLDVPRVELRTRTPAPKFTTSRHRAASVYSCANTGYITNPRHNLRVPGPLERFRRRVAELTRDVATPTKHHACVLQSTVTRVANEAATHADLHNIMQWHDL